MSLALAADQQEAIDPFNRAGLYEYEANFPQSAGSWPAGVTVDLQIRSPITGEEDRWLTLHTFSAPGSTQRYRNRGRKYRLKASANPGGVWVWINELLQET